MCPFVSAAVTEQANCERGESNPSPLIHNQSRDCELGRVASEMAVNGQCLPDSTCLTLSAIDTTDTELRRVAARWSSLPDYIKQTILTLVDTAAAVK